MRFIGSVLLICYSFMAFAFDPTPLGGGHRPEINLVLGIDRTVPSYSSPYKFPCTEMMDNVYCDQPQIRFADPQCARTFFVDRLAHQLELSCQMGLRKMIIAKADLRVQGAVPPEERYGYIPIQLERSVRLKRVSSPRMGVELIVGP